MANATRARKDGGERPATPWVHRLTLAGWLLAGLMLIVGYLVEEQVGWSVVTLVVTVFAVAGHLTGTRDLFIGMSFAALATLAIFAVWSGVATVMPLIATACAVVAWDLSHFEQRMLEAEHLAEESDLPRQHLVRLLTTVGLGLGLGAAALIIRLNYGYWILMAVAAAAFIGVSLAVSYLRRESD